MVVRAHQSFQFFIQKSGFLEIIEACLNLGIGFCISMKRLVCKNQF